MNRRSASLALAVLALLAAPRAPSAEEPAPPAAAAAAAEPAPAAPAAAEAPEVEVVLKSGPAFLGTIAGEDGRNVLLRSRGGTIRAIPREAIARIGPPAPRPPAPAAAPAAPADSAAPVAGAAAPAAPAPAGEAGGATISGLGVSLRDVDLLSGMGTFYLPIQLASGVRIEPELGILTDAGDASLARLGVGVFHTWMAATQVRGYAGGRFLLVRTSVSDTDLNSFRVAAAAGAEWVPVPRVALGIEAQAGLTSLDGVGDSETVLATAGLAIVRVFIW